MRLTVRAQVKSQIIQTMAEAEKIGRCPLAIAEAVYPGIPAVILGECFGELSMDQADAWWRAVEQTIDGELVKRAVTAASA